MHSTFLSRRGFLSGTTGATLALLFPGIARAANIHELSGTVYINKQLATNSSMVSSGDLITTGHDGRISFSINGDAFLLKERTSIQIGDKDNAVINTLRLLTGKLLSVFEKGRDRTIATSSATIGIRGTACFLNVEPYKTYFCTCYGKTELRTPGMNKEFMATHHNAHELSFDGMKFMGMHSMQVLDHSDDELRKLESYVGRVPPFDQA